MFFKYLFLVLACMAHGACAGDVSANKPAESEGTTTDAVIGFVVIGAVAAGAVALAGPAVVAVGAVATKTAAVATVAYAKASAAVVATKSALLVIGPTVTKVYYGVTGTKVFLWFGRKVKAKVRPSTEQKLKQLVEQEAKEKSLEVQLSEVLATA